MIVDRCRGNPIRAPSIVAEPGSASSQEAGRVPDRARRQPRLGRRSPQRDDANAIGPNKRRKGVSRGSRIQFIPSRAFEVGGVKELKGGSSHDCDVPRHSGPRDREVPGAAVGGFHDRGTVTPWRPGWRGPWLAGDPNRESARNGRATRSGHRETTRRIAPVGFSPMVRSCRLATRSGPVEPRTGARAIG